MKFGNLVIAGLVTGSIYAVFAVCVSVWYRVSNILNLAVGDFAMLGALGVDDLVRVRNWPLPAAIITTLAVVAAFGYVYDRVVLRLALDGRNPQEGIVVTFFFTFALSFFTATVVVVGLIMVLGFGQQYAGAVFVLALCYAIVTAGMAVQIGFSQQIVFSQCVFMGAGAYGVAMLNTHFSMPSLLATPVVMAGSGLAALALGSVVTRASGLALAVATLMLPLIAVGYVSSAGFLGGSVGAPLTGNLWPGSSTQSIAIGNGLVTVALLAVVVFVASRILSSDIGLELYVLGVDEPTAAAMGVRTPRRRLELFVLGSVFAALGGAVYAGTQLFVPATLVSPTAELALLMMLFVGGRRSVLGAVTGAVAIQYLSGASNWVSVNILIVEGVLLTVVLLADPDGLAGLAQSLTTRLGARRLLTRPLTAGPLPARRLLTRRLLTHRLLTRPSSTPPASTTSLAPEAPHPPGSGPAQWNIEPATKCPRRARSC
jgi:ABC-type branched-subunit amino acid transport system permease subunit